MFNLAYSIGFAGVSRLPGGPPSVDGGASIAGNELWGFDEHNQPLLFQPRGRTVKLKTNISARNLNKIVYI